MADIPPEVDEKLWVRLHSCAGRHFPVTNPHTFRGRIGVWCEDDQKLTNISKSEISEASDEAWFWVDGFLVGDVPSPEEFFGPSIEAASSDDPRWVRWAKVCHEFRTTGHWPHPPWIEFTAIDRQADLAQRPFAARGDELWTWSGSEWLPATARQAFDFRDLEGVCLAEQGHSMAGIDQGHLMCERCGMTDEATSDRDAVWIDP